MSNKRQKLPASDLPKGSKIVEESHPKDELIMALTTRLPDRYEDLDKLKRHKIEVILKSLQAGAMLKDACAAAEMSDVTFYRMRKKYSWVEEAVGIVLESRCVLVEDALYRAAIGYEYELTDQSQEEVVDAQGFRVGNLKRKANKKRVTVGPSSAAIIFYLKNRSGGRYKSDFNLKIEQEHTHRIVDQTDERRAIRTRIKGMDDDQLTQVLEMGRMLSSEADDMMDARATAADDSE